MPNLVVFVSWSGERSRVLGESLVQWLPGIVSNIKTFFSPTITPGSPWTKHVERGIHESDFAILCVTRDNLDSQWMNFEAGALWHSPGKDSYVCPLLLDIAPERLKGPLSLFQARRFDEPGFKQVCKHLAAKTGQDLDRFQGIWVTLSREVKKNLRALTKAASRKAASKKRAARKKTAKKASKKLASKKKTVKKKGTAKKRSTRAVSKKKTTKRATARKKTSKKASRKKISSRKRRRP